MSTSLWPRPIPAWFWPWAAWYLGRDQFKGHAREAALRPKDAPARIPAWAWARLALIAAGKPAPPPPPKPIRVKALDALRGKLGTTESPAGSNRCWASTWYGFVSPWCAMAVTWAYVTSGSKTLVRGARYAYVPYIVADAKAGRNGLRVTTDPEPGDLVCYDWETDGTADHVGLFEGWFDDSRRTFKAIEGNTSLGNDSNGGAVMRRIRDRRQVAVFVKVKE